MIDWAAIDRAAIEPLFPGPGQTTLWARLVASPLYLQHAFNLYHERVIAGWWESPQWKVLTGDAFANRATN